MNEVTTTHRQIFDRKVNALLLTIANIQTEGKGLHFDDELVTQMCRPYFNLLQNIYAEELPFIRAVEESDLVLWLEGPALDVHNPRVSLISTIFRRVRVQVANVAKAIAHLSDSNRQIPRELDLGLSALARGSLVLGFTLPSPEGLQPNELGQENLLGEQDPLYRAAREAIRTIGVVTEQVSASTTEAIDRVYGTVSDPEVRDATLIAIAKLAPTGRNGVESVRIGGLQTEMGEHALTKETRTLLKPILRSPVRSEEKGTIIGEIREIDLDLMRFVIRNVENENINQLRCSFHFPRENQARHLLARRVKVNGRIERDKDGRARLMAVESIEEIGRKTSVHENLELFQ
jgi:hypothetical protein